MVTINKGLTSIPNKTIREKKYLRNVPTLLCRLDLSGRRDLWQQLHRCRRLVAEREDACSSLEHGVS
jgi:hypothetical protein